MIRPEADVVQNITRDLICEIIGKGCVEDGLVNKEFRLKDLKKLISESRDVLMIGIYGLGGTGKTAIARALYNEISYQFEDSSFLANIGEESKKDGLYCLQERLFCDILLGESRKIMFHRRNNLIEHKFRTKRVLIVLDDVNNEEQLKLLAGNHDWFGEGSRIIITSRDKCLLKRHKVDEYYQLEKLDDREALALLCHHALTEEQSPHCFFRLLNEVMSYCGHRPLALKVAGSFLRGKGLRQREAQLGKLAIKPDVFRVSYKELSDEEKDIFLDVACFFQGEYKDFVTKILEKHDFSAEHGLQVLSNRCLLTISEGKLWMDNSIQKMAWEIASKQALIPGKPCRLWDHKQILRVLKRNEGIRAIEGISLELSKSKDKKFSGEAFSQMDALRLLKVFLGSGCVNDKETYKVHFSTDFTFPSYDKLRYLHGHGYQLDSFPSNFEAEELLELNMPYSSLKQIEGDEIHFPNLIALDLSHSQKLETISNFSRMPNLERLVLEGCRSLVKVDPSIGNLKKLSLMNLKDCRRLKSLPKRICEFEFLESLILAGCSRLEKLLGDWEERQSSVNLKASRTYRRFILPRKLRILRLGHCKSFQEILKLRSSIQEVDAYNCISMGTFSWNTRLGASILQRIKINPESAFSIVLPGNTIPDCWVTHKVTGSSVTMELQNSDWYNDDFLGFSVCLVFAPQAERPQLNPEILCDLNNFTFFHYCGEDSVAEFPKSYRPQARARAWHTELDSVDQECGNTSTDHVWLAYRPQARADRCHPKERNRLKASFEVFNCVVKECAIRLIYKKQVVFGQEAQ
ncbi:disease resistance protein RPV1-like [Vitis riparia]|uniref:disease resistance protein RPV1-like n=1 Tax=Vitis riparia TaxID=96939 RepID=UPI00155A4948|nr:disease resistance protein RPV1-like [Vitis riparia]